MVHSLLLQHIIQTCFHLIFLDETKSILQKKTKILESQICTVLKTMQYDQPKMLKKLIYKEDLEPFQMPA